MPRWQETREKRKHHHHKIMRWILLYIICFVSSLSLNSQDMHFSEFYASPVNLNPALTGLFDGKFRIALIYRDQYRSVTVPYQTVGVSAEGRKKHFLGTGNNLGYGILINRDVAGDGKFGITQLNIPIASHYPISKYFIFSYGGSLTLQNNTLDMEALRFPSQFNGFQYVDDLPIGENNIDNSDLIGLLNAGTNLRFNKENRLGFGAGFSIFNINSPTFSFLENNYDLPVRLLMHSYLKIPLFTGMDLIPSAKLQSQRELREYQIGAQAFNYIQGYTIQWINYGAWMRTKDRDAIILNIGFKYYDFIFGFNYDINLSTLTTASNGHGAFEFSITFVKDKGRKGKKREMIQCPTYL